MTFTYSPEHLQSDDAEKRDLARTRLALGDTVESDPKLDDAEIAYFLASERSFDLAVVAGAEAIAALYSHEASYSVGQARYDLDRRAERYLSLAESHRKAAKKKSSRFLPINRANAPYNFEVGMHDDPPKRGYPRESRNRTQPDAGFFPNGSAHG